MPILQVSTFLTMWSCLSSCPLSSCPLQYANFSCEQLPLLLLSSCPTFCFVHHGRFCTRRVHFVYINFVGMFFVTPVVSIHFDQASFILLFTSFSAPPFASNNESMQILESLQCRHIFSLSVDGLIFVWAWHTLFFLCSFVVRGIQTSMSVSSATQLNLNYMVTRDQVVRKPHHLVCLLQIYEDHVELFIHLPVFY